MGSYAYLCATEQPRLCPVFLPTPGHPRPAIAHGKYAVPVLWALLFEAQDLTDAEVIDEEGEAVRCWAPFSTTDRALDILQASASKLAGVLGPKLEGYVALLTEELRARAAMYVTLDVLDLVAMNDTDAVRPAFEALYRELGAITSAPPAPTRGLRGLFTRPPKVLQCLTALSGYRPKTALLDARCLITNTGLTVAGLENHWAMLGSQYGGPVAWDPGDAVYGTAREVIAAREKLKQIVDR